jgi:quinol monooxygenase YgiN
MFIVCATVQIRAGMESEFETIARSVFTDVATETDTVTYVLHRSVSVPGQYFFYEKYRSKDAFEYHLSTPYIKRLLGLVGTISTKDPVIETFEDLESIPVK